LHHALNLLGCDGARPALLAEEVHHVRRKLVACLEKEKKKGEYIRKAVEREERMDGVFI
jgi:hypothetical protein